MSEDARSAAFAWGLGAAVLVLVLLAAGLFVPVVRCADAPHIFTITTNLTVPGGPITDPFPVTGCFRCANRGRASLYDFWRTRGWRSTLVY